MLEGSAASIFSLQNLFQRDGWVDHWQTLIAGLIALLGALIGGYLIHRQITASERIEKERRHRKFMASRAVLPLTLSTLSEYSRRCGGALKTIYETRRGEVIPNQDSLPPLPVLDMKVINDLKELVEFDDGTISNALESLLRELQLQTVRLNDLWNDLRGTQRSLTVVANIEEFIIDTGLVYAWCAAMFDFARQESDTVPSKIHKKEIHSAINQIGFWADASFNRIHATADRRFSDEPYKAEDFVSM